MSEIELNSARKRRRKIISKVLVKYDLEDLIKAGFGADGYDLEVDKIECVLSQRKNFANFADLIKSVFSKQFLTKYQNGEVFSQIAQEITSLIGKDVFSAEFNKLKALSGKMSVGDDGELCCVIHKDFVVKAIGAELFVNGKLFDLLDDIDLKETLLGFCKNDGVYYCQYITRHRWQKSTNSLAHFKIVKKQDYDFYKLPDNYDIECVFDIEKAIPIPEIKSV